MSATRKNTLAHAYQVYTRTKTERANQVLLPSDVFSEFVRENGANLEKRPDPANGTQVVGTWNPMEIDERFESETDPQRRAAWYGISRAIEYVSFKNDLLPQLTRVIEQGIGAMRESTGSDSVTTITCLALPHMRLTKSSMWFNAWAWKNLRLLRDTVDFIIPSLTVLSDILECIDDPAWHKRVNVLFIDDMVYSGSQFKGFCQTIYPEWIDNQTVYALIHIYIYVFVICSLIQ